MFRIIFLIFLCVYTFKADGQFVYKAVYKYELPEIQVAPSLNAEYKIGDTAKISKDIEKYIVRNYYANKLTICICSDKGIAVDLYNNDSVSNLQTGTGSYLHLKKSGSFYTIVYYEKLKMYTYYNWKDSTIENCRFIDTSIHLIKTGRAKKINNRDCLAYKYADSNRHEVILWFSNSLPYYVNPGIVSDIKAGLVQMEYNNVKITLIDLTKSTLTIPEEKCNTNTIEKTNLISNFIATIKDALK